MSTRILINGIIGWDVTVEDIKNQLNESSGDITVEIASNGGLVYPGIAIYNLFKNYNKGSVTMEIIGLAASMASFIPLAGDKIVAHSTAVYMIHNALNGLIGNYLDMRKNADYLESISNLLAKAYERKTGKSLAEIKKLMDDESFFFGDEMLEAGFVDEIIEDEKKEEKDRDLAITEARAEISNCKNTIKDLDMTKEDIEKAAACIDFMPETKNEFSPAVPGKIIKKPEEAKKMATLKELLSENPGASEEYNNALSTARTESENKIMERVNASIPFIGNEKYPTLSNVALDVISGKQDKSVLTASAAAVDAIMESTNSLAAGEETQELPETPAEDIAKGLNESGICETEEDLQAEIKRTKELNGGNK